MIVETIDIEGFYILFAIGSNWKELLPIDFCTKNSEQEIIMSDYAELAPSGNATNSGCLSIAASRSFLSQ